MVHLVSGVGAPRDGHLGGHVVVPGVVTAPVVARVQLPTRGQGGGADLELKYFLLKKYLIFNINTHPVAVPE